MTCSVTETLIDEVAVGNPQIRGHILTWGCEADVRARSNRVASKLVHLSGPQALVANMQAVKAGPRAVDSKTIRRAGKIGETWGGVDDFLDEAARCPSGDGELCFC
jgi:hypothetical protein